MNPLERIVIGLLFDVGSNTIVFGKDGQTRLGRLISDFLRSFVESPLLGASTDLFIGLTGQSMANGIDLNEELWRRQVVEVVQRPQLLETAENLLDVLVKHESKIVGVGIPVRARWALVLSDGIPKIAFGNKAPTLVDHFGLDFVPVLIGTETYCSVWGMDTLEVRPELLKQFLSDVISELHRCVWGMTRPADLEGPRFGRWISEVVRRGDNPPVAGRGGVGSDIAIDPKIEISVRGGWRPIE